MAYGYLGILLLSLGMTGATDLFALAHAEQPFRTDNFSQAEPAEKGPLNIRLSQRPVSAPENLVKANVELTDVRAARMFVGPSPKAAILEDDHHQRVVILSALEDGRVQAQLLTDIDFSPRIPFISACAQDRECAYDRRPVTGGLGCIAICVQQALKPDPTP